MLRAYSKLVTYYIIKYTNIINSGAQKILENQRNDRIKIKLRWLFVIMNKKLK